VIRSAAGVAIAGLLAAVTMAGVHAQDQVTFRSGVDLVRMDVRVLDAAGRPITDLRQDEITVTEGGDTLPVVSFLRVTEPAEAFVDAAARAVTAEVSSNEAFPRGHLYLLVFDQAHITPGNEQRVRLAAEQFIRRDVRPADRVALFAVPGPGPQVGFTADRTRIIDELSKVQGVYQRVATTPFGNVPVYDAHRITQGDERLIADTIQRLTNEGGGDLLGVGNATVGGRGAGAGEESGIARRLLVENARTIVNRTDAESRQFLQRLVDVIRTLGDIEGRKSVILFSEGFFPDNLSRELEAVAAAAAQTYAVFYTFDLNRRGPSVVDASAPDTTQGSEIQARIAPLGTLAVETDGTFGVDASGRSKERLAAIARQAQDYYLIGFEPSARAREQRDGYRRVTIRVSRPGATVSTRSGYSLGATATVGDRQRALSAVLGAPFVQQGLKVDYTTYLLKADTPGQQRVVLSLQAQLPVRSADTDRADIVFVARDVRDGRVVASGSDSIPLPASGGDRAFETGHWRVQFSVPAGTYLMRAVVREPGGLAGSADRRLDVRPLDTPNVAVSDLILGSPTTALPVRAAAYTVDGLRGMLEAYARAGDQLRDLTLRVTVRTTDGREALATYVTPLPAPTSDGDGFLVRAPFTMPLADVAPGAYVVHASLEAPAAPLAERTRFVDVVEGTAGPGERAEAMPAPAPGPVSPRDIIEGQLGQALLAELLQRSENTPLARATEAAVQGRWEEAEAAATGTPTGSDLAFLSGALMGMAHFVREDFPGAVTAWRAAADREPEHALTAFFLGWAYDRSGDTRAALTAWRGAAYLDPLMVSAHLALAEGYLKIQQPDLARQALRAGLEALPNSAELLARLRQIEGR
jgi:VWFA-related protein